MRLRDLIFSFFVLRGLTLSLKEGILINVSSASRAKSDPHKKIRKLGLLLKGLKSKIIKHIAG